MNRLLLCTLVLVIAVYSGTAIKCFVCDSEKDARCGEKFTMTTMQNCPSESTHCSKSNRTIDGGKVHTWRTCATGTDLMIKMEGCVKHTVQDYTAICNTDGCNGSIL
ncbi:uncharacterized protein [Anabrus simplex]|uniref:uncharacterized protein n=1 Tax=Anabrus simplex TaxID=316456 RepID=UPI0034DD74CF